MSIPRVSGVNLVVRCGNMRKWGIPRVSGGEPISSAFSGTYQKYSPRERG